jgi:hypothetical protein
MGRRADISRRGSRASEPCGFNANVASEQTRAVRHAVVGRKQHDVAVLIREAQHKDFRQDLADLPRREIDGGGNLPPNESRGLIVLRDAPRSPPLCVRFPIRPP